MKKLMIVLVFLALGYGIYEQTTEHPNKVIMAICVVIAFLGIMKYSSGIKSKNPADFEDRSHEDRG